MYSSESGNPIAYGVASYHTGGNIEAAHQHGHCGAEVFAISLFALEQEMVDAVGPERWRIYLQIVGVVGFQVGFHRLGFIVGGFDAHGDSRRQFRDSIRHIGWQGGVTDPEPRGVFIAGRA